MTEQPAVEHGINCNCPPGRAARAGAPPLWLDPSWSEQMRSDVTDLQYANLRGEVSVGDVVTLDSKPYQVYNASPVGVDVRPYIAPELLPDRHERAKGDRTDVPLRDLLGHRVRIWDGQQSSVFVDGEVIGLIECPTIIVRDDQGQLHYHASDLPTDVFQWHPRNYTPRSDHA